MTTLTIVHIKDCTCCESVIKTAEELAKEMSIELKLQDRNQSLEKYHFTGSLGLRINGEDIDPLTKDAPVVLKSCKIYRTEEGMKMIPTKKMIKEVLEKFQQPSSTINCCS